MSNDRVQISVDLCWPLPMIHSSVNSGPFFRVVCMSADLAAGLMRNLCSLLYSLYLLIANLFIFVLFRLIFFLTKKKNIYINKISFGRARTCLARGRLAQAFRQAKSGWPKFRAAVDALDGRSEEEKKNVLFVCIPLH